MKVLDNVRTELVTAVDIETARIVNNFEDLDEEWQLAWEHKNKKDGQILDNIELADLWQRTASLHGEFSKVCAVSLAYLDGQGQLVCKEFFGEDEKAILEAVAITLNNMKAKDASYRLVGHASKFFDYPFLSKRYVINELDIPLTLDSTNLKPWEGSNLCTNDIWKCGGTGSGSSLLALCKALNIPISKLDLVGDEVGKSYYIGEFERIGRYCSYDTVATFNIIRKFKKETIFQFDNVQYITAYSENILQPYVTEEAEEQPFLLKVFKATKITKEAKEELIEILAKKKLTKREKEILENILVSLYVDNTMFKSDKQDVKDSKRKEIQDLIKTLK